MSTTNNLTPSTSKTRRYFGQGTYGIIIGCPRLPSENERWDELLVSETAYNQVSKIIKDATNVQKVCNTFDLIHRKINTDDLAQLRKQIAIPTRLQYINWRELSQIPDEIQFLKSHKITNRQHKWHYLLERGTADLDTELRTVSTLNQLKYFLKGFGNIIDGIAALHAAGLVHTDIKLTNMIVSWDGRYKLIDLDELGDTTIIPVNKNHYEKLFNNIYYPYYSPACVFLKVLAITSVSDWGSSTCNVLFKTLIKKNYDKDYHKYFNDISQNVLKIADDNELSQIIREPYENDLAMINYLTDFKDRLGSQPNNTCAQQELLLFIDRYALGINLLILLGKYYRISGQWKIPNATGASDTTMSKCEFIAQGLIALIKLCCNPANYSVITTQQIANEYNMFITHLFRAYPFKFIIKLLSGFRTGIF